MTIEHVAIWTDQLEVMKDFYVHYFGGTPSEKYVNKKKQFASYFIAFDNGCRLELMTRPDIPRTANDVYAQFTGYIHMAFAVGSMREVEQLTSRLQQDGYPCIEGPRTTGDGYYESVLLDPDQNRIELTFALPHVCPSH